VSGYEELAVDAAPRGGRDRVARTLLAHPLVGQWDLAGQLGGGLLTARDPLLTAAVVDGIGAEAPRAEVTTVDVPPLAGAILLGLDETGLVPTAEQNVRSAYAQPHIPLSAKVTFPT
jgi:hypothetical protein